jgi:imidazolonepropionase-like amidohydrolase
MQSFTFLLAMLAVLVASPLHLTNTKAGQEVPGAPQAEPIAIVNATIHTVSGETLEAATVLFEGGKITAIGMQVSIPANAQRIDATGMHVYPGLIAANTSLGLNEIGAVRATRDGSETGELNPNVRAEVAYDPDSDIIPTVRSNGILLANVEPEGGLVSGISSLMRLDGWTREDIAVLPRSGMVLNWPSMNVVTAWWMRKSAEEQKEEIAKSLDAVHSLFREARAYSMAAEVPLEPEKRDLRLEAMRGVFDGSLPVIVNANSRQQIDAVLDLAQEFRIRVIIQGGIEAPLVADRLISMNVPVITRAVHSLPAREEDPYDAGYTLPKRLQDAGVQYCIADGGFWQVRSLPYQAGTAVAFGLTEAQALEAITLSPAKIFGIADRFGSIEIGKSATLFVTAGNVLEARSNVVKHAWIDGRLVDLSNRNTRLSDKYRKRYER